MNHITHCRQIIYHSFTILLFPFSTQARVVVGDGVRLETVAELELDHTGYVVCQSPLSYDFEDMGEEVAVIVVDMDVQFDVLVKVEIVIEDVAAAEAFSVAAGDVTVTVFCSAALTVTVVAAGVIVTKKISVESGAVIVAVDVSVSVPAGTISVEIIVNVVWGASDCVVTSMTVMVAATDPPAVGDGAPPSTGTTEYDALGISNGSGC